MIKLKLSSPCSFFSTDSPISIFDDSKKLFYYHENTDRKINFNLPVGVYFTNNSLIQRPFTPYESFRKPEKYISPFEFKIIIKDNPHKATISLKNKTITVDPKIANHYYKPCKAFLIGHEIGHTIFGGSVYNSQKELLFDAEKACDDFSRNWMLSHGYNPTQVKIACELLLKDKDRVNCIHENTINLNFRR